MKKRLDWLVKFLDYDEKKNHIIIKGIRVLFYLSLLLTIIFSAVTRYNFIKDQKYSEAEVYYYYSIADKAWYNGINELDVKKNSFELSIKDNKIIITPEPPSKGSLIFSIEEGKIQDMKIQKNSSYIIEELCIYSIKNFKNFCICVVFLFIFIDMFMVFYGKSLSIIFQRFNNS